MRSFSSVAARAAGESHSCPANVRCVVGAALRPIRRWIAQLSRSQPEDALIDLAAMTGGIGAIGLARVGEERLDALTLQLAKHGLDVARAANGVDAGQAAAERALTGAIGLAPLRHAGGEEETQAPDLAAGRLARFEHVAQHPVGALSHEVGGALGDLLARLDLRARDPSAARVPVEVVARVDRQIDHLLRLAIERRDRLAARVQRRPVDRGGAGSEAGDGGERKSAHRSCDTGLTAGRLHRP
jgi:hypothetical protein